MEVVSTLLMFLAFNDKFINLYVDTFPIIAANTAKTINLL